MMYNQSFTIEPFQKIFDNMCKKNISKIDINDERKSKSLFENILEDLKAYRRDTLSQDAKEYLKEIVDKKNNFYKL